MNTKKTTEQCFACGKKLGKNPKVVDTRDDQKVFVGSECYKEIKKTGENGWQIPGLKLRLYLICE